MKVEIRMWVDGVEIDLSPRFVELLTRVVVPAKVKLSAAREHLEEAYEEVKSAVRGD